MTLRWRFHEYGLVLLLAATTVAQTLRRAATLNPATIEAIYATPFRAHGLAFNFDRNILFPQIAQVLLLLAAYTAVQVLVRMALRHVAKQPIATALGIGITLPSLVFFIALGANALTWLARPSFFNYGGAGFHLLALFGFNDAPLEHLFSGFAQTLLLVILFTAAALIRECIARKLERPAPDRSQRILVANDISLSLHLFIALAVVVSSVQGVAENETEWLWKHVFSTLPSVLATVLVATYGFFRFHTGFNGRLAAKCGLVSVLTAACFAFLVRHHAPVSSTFVTNVIVNVCVGLPLAGYVYHLRREKFVALRSVQQKLSATSMQLQALQAQIQPHFLFNMLNTLYAHALREHAAVTADGIQKLGDMMRSVLDRHGMDAIPLSSEIAFLKNYIALNTLRMAETVRVDAQIEEDSFAHVIAPMILPVFVENAFKHGVSATRRSFIDVTLQSEAKRIRFTARNSYHGARERADRNPVGLCNVIERLNLTYPGRHHLEHGLRGDEYVVDLTIDLSRHA